MAFWDSLSASPFIGTPYNSRYVHFRVPLCRGARGALSQVTSQIPARTMRLPARGVFRKLHIVLTVMLSLAMVTSSVTVNGDKEQLSEQQLHVAEQQRIGGGKNS